MAATKKQPARETGAAGNDKQASADELAKHIAAVLNHPDTPDDIYNALGMRLAALRRRRASPTPKSTLPSTSGRTWKDAPATTQGLILAPRASSSKAETFKPDRGDKMKGFV